MNELMEKVENLMNALDSSSLVLSTKESQEKVLSDSSLMSMINAYSVYPREDLKDKILESPIFQEYKIKETDLNLFIMEMNQRLKMISSKGKCHHESN